MTTWRWLMSLEKMGCVSLWSVFSRCTVVTVVKYTTYQDASESDVQVDVQPVFNSCSTGVQPVFTDEESKKERRNTHTARERASWSLSGRGSQESTGSRFQGMRKISRIRKWGSSGGATINVARLCITSNTTSVQQPIQQPCRNRYSNRAASNTLLYLIPKNLSPILLPKKRASPQKILLD